MKKPIFDIQCEAAWAGWKTRLVVSGESLDEGVSSYKLYIDGNIYTTPPVLSKEIPGYIWLIPLDSGRHRVVMREFEAHKKNRLESNTLVFDLPLETEKRLFAKLTNGELFLIEEENEVASFSLKPLPSLQELENALVSLTLNAVAEFQEKHPTENFSAVGFDCNADHGEILLCFDTSEGGGKESWGEWKYIGANDELLSWSEGWYIYRQTILELFSLEMDGETRELLVDELMQCFSRAWIKVEKSEVIRRLPKTKEFYMKVIDHDEDEAVADQRLKKIRSQLKD